MRPSRFVLAFAMIFFVLGIGAKDCGPSGSPPASTKPFYYTDPPLGCAAYCSDVDEVSFTPACRNIEASDRELEFELQVMDGVQHLYAQGIQVCPQADPTSFVTPCAMGIFPVEHPNQDHEYCQTPPLNCPL